MVQTGMPIGALFRASRHQRPHSRGDHVQRGQRVSPERRASLSPAVSHVVRVTVGGQRNHEVGYRIRHHLSGRGLVQVALNGEQ